MSSQIPPEFSVSARVRMVRTAFSDPPSEARFIGKTGTVKMHVTSVGSDVVLFDDGSMRVCFPKYLELITENDSTA